MSTTLALPDVTAPIQALTVWLAQPKTKERMQDAVSEAVAGVEQYVLSDTSLRVPRQRAERRDGFRPWLDAFAAHGFEHWLNSYKHQLAQKIQGEMLSTFPEVFAGLRNRQLIRETVETLLWPEMEPLLRSRAEELLLTYAIRGIALPWASRNLGDGLLAGVPERQGTGWRVPLYLRSTERLVTYVELDRAGEVLSGVEELRATVETAAGLPASHGIGSRPAGAASPPLFCLCWNISAKARSAWTRSPTGAGCGREVPAAGTTA